MQGLQLKMPKLIQAIKRMIISWKTPQMLTARLSTIAG
jgi:hypothetical protein